MLDLRPLKARTYEQHHRFYPDYLYIWQFTRIFLCPYKCISFSGECFCCLCIQLQNLHCSRALCSSASLTAELQPSLRLPAVSQSSQQFYRETDLTRQGTKSVRLSKLIILLIIFSWQETQAFIRSTLLKQQTTKKFPNTLYN